MEAQIQRICSNSVPFFWNRLTDKSKISLRRPARFPRPSDSTLVFFPKARHPMNTRERFLAVLDFDKSVHSLKWDFGIWGEAVDRWYAEGLPKKNYPEISKELTTPTASLYGRAWRSVGEGKLAKGV